MDAKEVMVVTAVTELVVQVAILKEHPADDIGFHEDLEGAIYSGAPQAGRELPAQTFGGEVVLLFCYRSRQRAARRSGAEPRSSRVSRICSATVALLLVTTKALPPLGQLIQCIQ